jgi:hypothetical protein
MIISGKSDARVLVDQQDHGGLKNFFLFVVLFWSTRGLLLSRIVDASLIAASLVDHFHFQVNVLANTLDLTKALIWGMATGS